MKKRNVDNLWKTKPTKIWKIKNKDVNYILIKRNRQSDNRKNMNALVTPIEHVDVRGNKLLYLKIQGPNGETVVNIGQKTFDGVTKILQPRTETTTVNVLQPEIGFMQKPTTPNPNRK